MSAPPRVPPVPAVLRLVQMMVLGRWRATGEELYREVASLMEAQPGKEILVSGAGEGETSEWLAARTGASVTGVDADEVRVERAEARARVLKTPLALSYQHGQLDDLPHETNVFDAALAEPLLSAAEDPERAVAELARVTKPMGPVVLLELTWSSDMSESAREMLVERLGLRPRLLIEWKQMMREAGLVEIQVQDWTEAGANCHSSVQVRHAPGGASDGVYCVPQAVQIKAFIPAGYITLRSSAGGPVDRGPGR